MDDLVKRAREADRLLAEIGGYPDGTQGLGELLAARIEELEAQVREARHICAALIAVGDYLSVCAQTAGGTAGRDEGLVGAVEKWAEAKSALLARLSTEGETR